MTILSIIIAAAALAGFAAVWFQLNKVKATVNQLDQMHPTSKTRKVVDAGNVGVFPDEAVPEPKNFIILGCAYETIVLDYQSNGESNASKAITVAVPDGTTHIVPSIKGFALVFGRIIPGDEPGKFGADKINDNHLALQFAEVHVTEIGNGTATVEALMLLRDGDAEDAWSGVLQATLLFLGRHP